MSENQDSKRGPKPFYGARMTHSITIWFPHSIHKQLDKASKKLGRKRADLVRTAIEDFLSLLDRN